MLYQDGKIAEDYALKPNRFGQAKKAVINRWKSLFRTVIKTFSPVSIILIVSQLIIVGLYRLKRSTYYQKQFIVWFGQSPL